MAFPILMNEGKLFRKLGIITIGVIYLLILVGGVVRATGSGMGCPDWPKCFGMWVPPTSMEQLPANYQEIFGAKLKGEVEFNAVKTWVEYLNRLLGALSGLFVFAALIASVSYLKKDFWVVFWSFIAFILMGFQGWLGSKVVSTELKPLMVTLHMLVAILIVGILIYAVVRSYKERISIGKITSLQKLKVAFWLTLLVAIIQIVLGTQVRESIDIVAKELGEGRRAEWLINSGRNFIVHRTYSWLVVISNILLVLQIKNSLGTNPLLSQISKGIIVVLVLEVLFGIALAYLGMTPYAQPFHLTGAIALVGLHFAGIVLINRRETA